MATLPKIRVLTNTAPDVVNAIRNEATTNYKNYVPYATPDAESVRTIGAVLMDNPMLMNEFSSALINRIGKVIVTSKFYDNPWASFKKGYMDFGETVEEVFLDLAKPYQYDSETAWETTLKKYDPNIHSAFHILNYQKYYPVSINDSQLRQAFLSWDGVDRLIANIVDQMFSGANYDEFITMKYMIAKKIVQGMIKGVTISTTDMKANAAVFKGYSNAWEFKSSDYNIAGVLNSSEKQNQYLIMTADFDASFDVEVLASAFNMDKADFLGHRILVDSFANTDTNRLNILFAENPNYTEFTQDDLNLLKSVKAVLVDENFFMILDNLQKFTENYVGSGLYWNWFLHVWKTFSVSPFANAVAFSTVDSSIVSITVEEASVTLSAGETHQIYPTVGTTGIASQVVLYSSSNSDVTVSASGLVTVSKGAVAGTATITLTSQQDTTKTATVTVTIE